MASVGRAWVLLPTLQGEGSPLPHGCVTRCGERRGWEAQEAKHQAGVGQDELNSIQGFKTGGFLWESCQLPQCSTAGLGGPGGGGLRHGCP